MSRPSFLTRLSRALRAFRSNEPAAPAPERAPAAAPMSEDLFSLLHPERSELAKLMSPAGRSVMAWACSNRYYSVSIAGLEEWEGLLRRSPELLERAGEPLRSAMLEIDSQGAFFWSGHQLALEEIGAPNAQRWVGAYEAWTRLTRANTAEGFIDGLIAAQSSSQALRLLNAAAKAPGLDWAKLPAQSWAKLATHLPSFIHSLLSAAQSPEHWEAQGWDLDDAPAAREALGLIETADWPLERQFSPAEAKWLLAYFRKRGLGGKELDALGPTPTLLETLLCSGGSRAGFSLASGGLLRSEPVRLQTLLESAARAREIRALEASAAPAESSPGPARL